MSVETNEISVSMKITTAAKRRVVAERYWGRLRDLPGVRVCEPERGVESNYAYLAVIFDDAFGATRDEVHERLATEGVHARKYFYPLTNDFACYRGREGFDSSCTPVANYVASHVLTLPMYADLPLEDVDFICDIVASCAR